ANDPEADLYAAKCVQKNKGCMAAAPRFDANAQRNAGTETGSRAALEAARCYRVMGDARAQQRYAALKDDAYVADEVQADTTPATVAARKAAVAATPPAATAAPAKPAAAAPAQAPCARPRDPRSPPLPTRSQ